MARKAFFSFHYKPDNWRASQVRNMGVVEGNQAVSDNDWETVTKGRDDAIKKWIDEQMAGRSCVVVLVGSATAGRKWITHEISTGWNKGKGVLGVYVHNLKDSSQTQSTKGGNPLDYVTMKKDGSKLSTIAKVYDPPFTTSTNVYDHINSNIESWIDEAISIRAKY
ncbi:MAG: hypothetical protein JWR83_1619 [Aeromicrobium sp.]|nr:hypothetical protein [Aeromicrobium sp.]